MRFNTSVLASGCGSGLSLASILAATGSNHKTDGNRHCYPAYGAHYRERPMGQESRTEKG